MASQISSNETEAILTNASVPVGLSPAELWIQIAVFYVFISGGVFIINLAMAIGIIQNKELRNRFFVVLCALLFTRSALCGQNVIMGVYRILRTLNAVPTNMTRLTCHSIHFHLYYAPFLEMFLLFVLVVDRIVAITAWNFYRNLTVRQSIIVCWMALIVSLIIKQAPSYSRVSLTDVVPCININSPLDPLVSAAAQNLDFSLALLVLTLYGGLMSYLRCYRLPYLQKRADGTANQTALIAVKRQMKLLPLLRRLVLTHCGFALLAKLLLALAPEVAPAAGLRLTAYGGMTITVDLLVNAVMLLVTNGEVRRATLNVFGLKTDTAVVAISAHGGQ